MTAKIIPFVKRTVREEWFGVVQQVSSYNGGVMLTMQTMEYCGDVTHVLSDEVRKQTDFKNEIPEVGTPVYFRVEKKPIDYALDIYPIASIRRAPLALG